MEAIVKDGTRLDGFICPGHVAAITGSAIFDFLPDKYNTGCVVAGFEPADLLQAILMLVKQVNSNNPEVEIQYNRAVTVHGNREAKLYMNEVFENCDTFAKEIFNHYSCFPVHCYISEAFENQAVNIYLNWGNIGHFQKFQDFICFLVVCAVDNQLVCSGVYTDGIMWFIEYFALLIVFHGCKLTFEQFCQLVRRVMFGKIEKLYTIF